MPGGLAGVSAVAAGREEMEGAGCRAAEGLGGRGASTGVSSSAPVGHRCPGGVPARAWAPRPPSALPTDFTSS